MAVTSLLLSRRIDYPQGGRGFGKDAVHSLDLLYMRQKKKTRSNFRNCLRHNLQLDKSPGLW